MPPSSRSSRDPKPEPEPESQSRAAPVPKAASRDAAEPGSPKSTAREKSAAAQLKPVEEPATLVLRPARPTDAGALAKLLGQLSGVPQNKADLARDIAALRKAGAGVQIAELGRLVGCVAWAVVPTLQHGPVGRITVLIVDEDHQRQGIGTRLLAEAQAALAKKGCVLVEAMSDIEIKNAHNFFRTFKFAQTSYRFARKIVR
jgi:ribosomal protein S18 acetylase RimI-like enzyme